LSPECKDLI
jgi:serine/threonine protein kinase